MISERNRLPKTANGKERKVENEERTLGKPSPTCACFAEPLDRRLDRRRFLHLAGAGVATSALLPVRTLAEDKKRYEAMVLSCIDPRLQRPVFKYLEKLRGEYSQVTIAGAAIGAVAPRFEAWHHTFWENLSISLDLHRFPKVIVIQHKQCGAATEAYGYHSSEEAETKLHQAAVARFRKQLGQRHPQLVVEAVLMDLDGSVEELR